ncbi:MAG: exopolysaccharide biosynthesis polyprenyl glycosylphosphotransferase [Nibricoccus sp.]
MLKNRQEGLISVHGFCVSSIMGAVYLSWAEMVQATHLISFANDTNLQLYFLGAVGGALISTRLYRTVGGRLGYLNWMELVQITQRQLLRIALVLFALAFATKDAFISRIFLVSYLAVSSVVLYLLNCFLPGILARIFFRDNAVRTLFVGSPEDVKRLRSWILRKAHLGVAPVGFVCKEPNPAPLEGLPHFGRIDEISHILAEERIGQIVLLQFYLDHEESNKIVRAAQRLGCRVRLYNNLNAYYDHPITIDHEGEYTFFTLEDEPLENPVNRIKKRCLDIAISLPVVVFLLPPLTLLVALMQRAQSPGPIFYPQLRTGINKRRFNIWKFRTMHVAAQTKDQEVVQARAVDSRVYPFGRFLRRTSLDEIPQFLNVLVGEMSVSGPRPHMIEHDEQFAKLLHNYYSRHYVKPGITGLAQSKGFRGEISELALLEKRVGYDMIYINQWSLLLDIKILFATARQVIFPPKTAY